MQPPRDEPPTADPTDSAGRDGTERSEVFRPRPFRPAAWLPGPHLQTLGGRFLRDDDPPLLDRVRVRTSDGDFVDLDLGRLPGVPEAPVVVILHGLEGSSRRPYVVHAYRLLLERGIRPVGMNFRGCSGEPNRTARFYHSGETGDLRRVLEWLGQRFPDSRLGALGFSLGGNVLLKHLGERGGENAGGLAAAVAVSVPFDLESGSSRLEEGLMGRLYTYYFLRMLRKKIRWKERLLSGRIDVRAALAAPTLRAFDDAATAPLHGFRSSADYYRSSSSGPYLGRIRIPTLLLQSRDDPFLPEWALPLDVIGKNPHLVGGITDRGGHVGFVEGTPRAPRFWAEEEAARFLAAFLGGE